MTRTPYWPRIALDDMLDALRTQETGPGRLVARGLRTDHPSVLGSQLLGLTVATAERTLPGMRVQSLHTVFPRGGRAGEPIDVAVETVQSGRFLATLEVSFRQRGREHCRAVVMLTRDEPDFVRHGVVAHDDLPGPDACEAFDCPLVPWETRVEGGIGAWDRDASGPAAIDLWMRCKDLANGDRGLSRSLLAHAVEAFVIPVGVRPYPQAELVRRGGSGLSVVLAQTVTFHEPFDLAEWLLLRVENVYAGRGRMHSRFQAFADGRLVASAGGDGLLRAAVDG
ncbi:thioesterase family protein [Streptomyces sp. SID4956]|uniref:acyl-CoA thioesterase domain-containing protein n=1 Tax=Streptomyces sp. SID4956 TaxID=2690290 RepID=UPI00136A5F9D|nr:hypothetical protein [Streptomyces sp. SID4956]